MSKRILLIWLVVLPFLLAAQEANVFYFMPNVPQAVQLNPALHNAQRKVVVGVAALNGFYGSLNSEASLSDLLSVNEENKTILNIEKLADAVDGDGEIIQSFSVPLLFFGYNAGNNHFHFSMAEREPLSFYFTDDLLKILKYGNAPFAGQTTEMRLDMQLLHFGEYALGYSRDLLNKRLTVGATVKLLFGKSSIKADDLRLGIYTQPDGEFIDLSGQGGLYFGGPFENSDQTLNTLGIADDVSAGSYLTDHSSPGFAVNLGATYQVNPKIKVAASVTDWGGIKWKKNATGYNLEGNFTWEGVDVSNGLNQEPNVNDELINLLDSLGNAFEFNQNETVFRTPLTTRLYLGGSVELNKVVNIGVVNRISFHPTHNVTNMFMLTANANFNNILSLTGSYAVSNGSYNNFGMGLAVRAGFAQFILGTNNVYQLIKADKAQYTSVRFGINFLFGKPGAKSNARDKSVN